MAATKSNKMKNNKEQSTIKKKLLECASRHKYVLLHGKRPLDFRALVNNVYDSISNNLEYIDCDAMDGEDFYNKLVRFQGPKFPTEAGYICYQTCTLFFDNLHYYPENKNEAVYYNKAGKSIRKGMFQASSSLIAFDPEKDYRDEEITIIDEKVNLLEIANGVTRVVAYTNDIKPFPTYFLKQFELVPLGSEKTQSKIHEQVNTAKPNTEEIVKLKIVQNTNDVYWSGNLIPSIKDTHCKILLALAKTPGSPVMNDVLFKFIDSKNYEGVLLSQRISAIRKAFPYPYSDIKHPQCIIPDAKLNKGFRSLNLTKEQVEIVKK